METGVRSALIGGFSTEPAHGAWTLWATESYAALFALYVNAPRALEGLLTELRPDRLTDCLTYEGLRVELASELNRSSRARVALSCCLIQVDGLARLERQAGPERRSEVLKLAARTLREGVRSCDSVGRGGDDQFIAILPGTVETDARQLAERLTTLLAIQHVVENDGPLTASSGVATWSPGELAEQLLARAAGDLLAAAAPTRASANGDSGGLRATNRSTRLTRAG